MGVRTEKRMNSTRVEKKIRQIRLWIETRGAVAGVPGPFVDSNFTCFQR